MARDMRAGAKKARPRRAKRQPAPPVPPTVPAVLGPAAHHGPLLQHELLKRGL